jgi:hypothetical protein
MASSQNLSAEKQGTIVAACSTESSITGNFLSKGAVLSDVDLVLPEETTSEQWEQIGYKLSRLENATSWWLGAWWVFGEHKWGDRKAIVESEGWRGRAYNTCIIAGATYVKFQRLRRRSNLTFSHHVEVSSLDPNRAGFSAQDEQS